MATNKNITIHPHNQDGTPNESINLYPKTIVEQIEDFPQGEIDVTFTANSSNILQSVTAGDITYTIPQGTPIVVEQSYNASSSNPQSGTAVAGAIASMASAINAKQNALDTTQLSAVNSGITAEKVAVYDDYSSTKLSINPDGENTLLDTNNKIQEMYIPDSLLGQVEYCGTWDADTGEDQTIRTPRKGDYYICSTSGGYLPDGTEYEAGDFDDGDWAIYDGISSDGWNKVDNTDAVTMVNNQIGNVHTYKGTWTTNTKYFAGDFVKDVNGVVYLCIQTETNIALTNTDYWHSFAIPSIDIPEGDTDIEFIGDDNNVLQEIVIGEETFTVPQGSGIIIDQNYDSASTNPQSGTAVAEAISTKQSALSTTQLSAVNSGITSTKVSTYDGYSSTKLAAKPDGNNDLIVNGKISSTYIPDTLTADQTYNASSSNPQSGKAVASAISTKQSALSTDQLNAVNSGITSGKVTTYDGYSSGKLDVKPDGTNNLIVDNKIGTTYIPDTLLGQVNYKGTWDAGSSTQSISSPAKGDYYICTGAGKYLPTGVTSDITFAVGDWAIYNSTTAGWSKVDNTDAVTMVNDQIGNVHTYKGTWTTNTKYFAGDFVKDVNGVVYLCIQTGTNIALTNTAYWQPSADQAYSSTSTNAQSGKAVAAAIAEIDIPEFIGDDNNVLQSIMIGEETFTVPQNSNIGSYKITKVTETSDSIYVTIEVI